MARDRPYARHIAIHTNLQIDTSALQQEIDSLDPDDKHYRQRKLDLDERLYRMYDKIQETESALIERKAKKQAIEADKITSDNIYRLLTNFDKLYAVTSDAEKHEKPRIPRRFPHEQ